jgi:murein DD-endopeptidase MepM/ murein hydrolase activator NlpD
MKNKILWLSISLIGISACGGGGGGSTAPATNTPPPVVDPSPPPGPALETVTLQVPIAGGQVILPDVAGLSFRSGSFSVPTDVTISLSSDAEVDRIFSDTSLMFKPGPRTAYEVRFNVGSVPVESSVLEVLVNFTIPVDLAVQIGVGAQADMFLLSRNDGGMERGVVFALMDSANEENGTITSVLTPADFSNATTIDGTYEAVMLLAITPGKNRIPPEAGFDNQFDPGELSNKAMNDSRACPADPLNCPLAMGCDDPGAGFQNGRKEPGTQIDQRHYGQDYPVPQGTAVVAAKAGTVESAGAGTSFGNTIIIRHSDGARTLYAHLLRMDVQQDDAVTAGQQIGLSGSTGEDSAGEHLHFEYAPRGDTIFTKERIDPHTCIVNPDPPQDPFVGTWFIDETYSSDDAECSGSGSFTATVTRQGNSYDISIPFRPDSGPASGGLLRASLSATYREAARGQIKETGSAVFTSLNRFVGKSSWTYTEGSFTCDGLSTYEGTK